MPTSPSRALLGQHREPRLSEAPSCQVFKPVLLQSLNFKLGRDCKVPEGREQERCLRGRGPGGWALGARGLHPGPAQHGVSAGNVLSTASLCSPSRGSPHLSSAQPPADSQVTGPTGRRPGVSICNVDYSHEIFFRHTETRISAWRREHNDINNISYHLLNIHPQPSSELRPFTGSSISSHEEMLLLFLQVRRLRLRKPLASGRSQTWAWWSDSKAHPHRLCHHSEEE